MNVNLPRNLNHVSLCCGAELEMLGFWRDDDVENMCQSLVVDREYSVDENCYWPVLRCQAILDAEMLINNESCEWTPWYRYQNYEGLPF